MPNIPLSKNTMFWLVTSLLTIFIFYRLYQATTWGAGLSSDSVAYIGGARSILANWNLSEIGSHYPPLYFILIAFVGLITGDALEGLRTLQLLTIVLNCIIFSLIIWKGTSKKLLITFLGSLLFVTSQAVLYVHTMAWSEGSFLFFTFTGFYFLANYLENQGNGFHILALSAFFISLAFLTRYVGVTLIATGIVVLIFYNNGSTMKRIKHLLCFIFLCSFPMLLRIGHNYLVTNGSIPRHIVVHLISIDKIRTGINVLCSWLYIPTDYHIVMLIMLVTIAILYFVSNKNIESEHKNKMLEISLIFIFIYILFLLVSISLFDASIPLDVRILVPVYLFFMIALLILSYRIFLLKSIKYISYVIISFLFIISYFQFDVQGQYLSSVKCDGSGFASKKWVQSDMLQWIKKLPHGIIIYSNGPDAIDILANRPSKMIPRLINYIDRKKNQNYKQDFNIMISEISNNKGIIVYFDGLPWRNWYLPSSKKLGSILPLRIKYNASDGIAFGLDSKIKN